MHIPCSSKMIRNFDNDLGWRKANTVSLIKHFVKKCITTIVIVNNNAEHKSLRFVFYSQNTIFLMIIFFTSRFLKILARKAYTNTCLSLSFTALVYSIFVIESFRFDRSSSEKVDLSFIASALISRNYKYIIIIFQRVIFKFCFGF